MTARFLRRGLYRAHFVLAAVVGALAFVGLSAVGLLYVLFRPRGDAPLLLAREVHWTIVVLLGWRVRVEGRALLSASAPAVWMARHMSNLDIVVYGGLYPRRTVVIGKKEIARIPVFGWFFRSAGNVLLDRGDLSRAIASIRAAAERVRSERISVWVFPEGHRNASPQLLPFKKGAFHLAISAQVPIVPIVAEPVSSLLDGHRLLVRPGTLQIKVLPPVPTEGLSEDDVESLVATVRATMQDAEDSFRASGRAPIG